MFGLAVTFDAIGTSESDVVAAAAIGENGPTTSNDATIVATERRKAEWVRFIVVSPWRSLAQHGLRKGRGLRIRIVDPNGHAVERKRRDLRTLQLHDGLRERNLW